MTCSPGEWATFITAFALLLSSLAASLGALLRACQSHTILKQLKRDSDEIAGHNGAAVRPDLQPR
jgi:hypothetical protein